MIEFASFSVDNETSSLPWADCKGGGREGVGEGVGEKIGSNVVMNKRQRRKKDAWTAMKSSAL